MDRTQTPGKLVFHPTKDGYPDTPFWNLVLSVMHYTPPKVEFLDSQHNFFGFPSFEKWEAAVNAHPERWTIQGSPASFAIMYLGKETSNPVKDMEDD